MCDRNFNQLPFAHALTGDWAHNPGMCLDLELNRRPFALWDDTQPTELVSQGEPKYFQISLETD